MKDRPVALVILDGWGIPCVDRCAVTEAKTANFTRLWRDYPHTSLDASAEAVGLMPGQMGDSNVGHLNIGAGRIVYQDIMRISRDIESGVFFRNPALLSAMKNAAEGSASLHLMGLVSDGGVHSLETHLFALLEMAKDNGVERAYVHAFLDGRDVPPRSAETYLGLLEDKIADLGAGHIASVTGRYWAMDRDKRWDRVQKAYRLLAFGEGLHAPNWRSALKEAYARGESDEFVAPTAIDVGGPAVVKDGDSVIFFNFRADRAREITHAFVDEDFSAFDRGPRLKVHYCGMMRYEESMAGPFAYLPLTLDNTLGEVVSRAGLKQLRIAETEKYAHVTFFLNGKKDDPFPGEERVLIPSPKSVATYDLKPEMSAGEVTAAALDCLKSDKFDFIVMNYANPDMVGHTGVFEAAVKAVETVDECLGRFAGAVLEKGGALLIIADHGNVEDVVPPIRRDDGSLSAPAAHTYHSMNPVPCILAGDRYRGSSLRRGVLADVAPTVLGMLGIPKPAEMDRETLLISESSRERTDARCQR